jgi:hypothetical protein
MNRIADKVLTYTPVVGVAYVLSRQIREDAKDKPDGDNLIGYWKYAKRRWARTGRVVGIAALNALEAGTLFALL